MIRLTIALSLLLMSLFSVGCAVTPETERGKSVQTHKMNRNFMPPAFGGQYGGK